MSNHLKPYALLAGRVLLSAIFLLSGTMKLLHWSDTAQNMASKGMPVVSVLLALAVLLELGGGLCILFGFQARYGALALVLFLIPATLVFHDFWSYQGLEQQRQVQHFLKNVAIIGGLLSVAANGAGAFSLDALRHRSKADWFLQTRQMLMRR